MTIQNSIIWIRIKFQQNINYDLVQIGFNDVFLHVYNILCKFSITLNNCMLINEIWLQMRKKNFQIINICT